MADSLTPNSAASSVQNILYQSGAGAVGNQNLVALAAQGDLIGTANWDISFAYDSTINQHKVFIYVPPQYRQSMLYNPTLGARLDAKNGGWNGIYFPVTPSIKQDSKANWEPVSVVHSNYPFYAYKNSDPGSISVSGKFPVQNLDEAMMWVATVHTLRALQKMTGATDPVPGAPPPVCKFYAYGNMLYNGVPVVISSFSVDYSDDVDYLSVGNNKTQESVRVPVLSTISVTLLPVYSRTQVNKFTVGGFVNASGKTGLLSGTTGPNNGYI